MKKTIAIILTALLLVSCCSTAFAAVESTDLPFELKPAESVAMSHVEGDSSTSMNFSYSMDEDMVQFMNDLNDTDKKEQIVSSLGIDDIWVDAQIDWAIDNSGWHYTQYWDTDGYDSDYRIRVSDWDVTSVLLYPQTSNSSWIMRGVGNINDTTNVAWYGDETQPALKDQLDRITDGDGHKCYTVVDDGEGEAHFEIDFDNHTAYARMRYFVTVRPIEGDDYRLFSDWSEAASYGKDGDNWKPYTSDTLAAPVISNLHFSDVISDGYPLGLYDLEVPATLAEGLTNVEANGGTIRIETEARVKGSSTWVKLDGIFWVTPGELVSSFHGVTGYGKPIPKGTVLEFRARYLAMQYVSVGGDALEDVYSPYSRVLTITTTQNYPGSGSSSTTDDGKTSEPPIKNLNNGATQNQVKAYVEKLKSEGDPAGGKFILLSARQKKVTGNSITITWNKVKNAKTYMVFGNKCGKKNAYQHLVTTKGNTYTYKNLLKGTYYKLLVVAFNKSGKSIATSKTMHITTKSSKQCNFKSVKTAAKKNKITLKKGKTFNLKAKAVPESKKLKVLVHRVLKYESSNPKIATVSKGKVKAKKKGTCYVYAYSQSGTFAKIKVTVKK